MDLSGVDPAMAEKWYELEMRKLDLGERRLAAELRRIDIEEKRQAHWQARFPVDRSDIAASQSAPIQRDLQEQAQRRQILVQLIRQCQDNGQWCPTATAGTRTAYSYLRSKPDFPFVGHGARHAFWTCIEQLEADSVIKAIYVRRGSDDRHKMRVYVVSEQS